MKKFSKKEIELIKIALETQIMNYEEYIYYQYKRNNKKEINDIEKYIKEFEKLSLKLNYI